MLIKYIHMRCKRTKEGNFETQKQHSVKFYYCFDIIFIPYSPRPNGPMGSLVLYKSNCIYIIARVVWRGRTGPAGKVVEWRGVIVVQYLSNDIIVCSGFILANETMIFFFII